MFLQILVLQALTKISEPVNRKDLLGQHHTFFTQILSKIRFKSMFLFKILHNKTHHEKTHAQKQKRFS